MEDLDLKQFFSMFWHKKVSIIVITIIFAIIGVIYSYNFVMPMYSSSISLLLTKTDAQTDATQTITQSDLTLNQKLVSTYSELLTSKSVLSETLSRLKISDLQWEDLKDNVTVKSVNNTEVLKITVNNKNPEYATKIANEIAGVFTEKVEEIYNINNIYIVDKAETSNVPYNINHKKDITMFAIGGMFLAFIYVFIINMLDTTIKSAKEIEQILNIPVLVSIPATDNINKGGKK